MSYNFGAIGKKTKLNARKWPGEAASSAPPTANERLLLQRVLFISKCESLKKIVLPNTTGQQKRDGTGIPTASHFQGDLEPEILHSQEAHADKQTALVGSCGPLRNPTERIIDRSRQYGYFETYSPHQHGPHVAPNPRRPVKLPSEHRLPTQSLT